MKEKIKNNNELENKAWYRTLKVLWIISYLPLPILLWLVALDLGRDYHFITNSYTWDIGRTVISLGITTSIYMVIIELIKKAVLYIILGKQK